MKAYLHNATDREARQQNMMIIELRSQPNGGGRFLYSMTASSSNETSIHLALSQIEQWASANGYEVEG